MHNIWGTGAIVTVIFIDIVIFIAVGIIIQI